MLTNGAVPFGNLITALRARAHTRSHIHTNTALALSLTGSFLIESAVDWPLSSLTY